MRNGAARHEPILLGQVHVAGTEEATRFGQMSRLYILVSLHQTIHHGFVRRKRTSSTCAKLAQDNAVFQQVPALAVCLFALAIQTPIRIAHGKICLANDRHYRHFIQYHILPGAANVDAERAMCIVDRRIAKLYLLRGPQRKLAKK